jgi:hypothetical protein
LLVSRLRQPELALKRRECLEFLLDRPLVNFLDAFLER